MLDNRLAGCKVPIVYLGHPLHAIRQLVSYVQFILAIGGIGDHQQSENLLLVYPDGSCNPGQALTSFITCFIHHADVEKLRLVLE
jgi:hypothetical protein